MSNKPRKMTLEKKHNLTGWAFLAPATFLIAVFSFWPMIKALVLSFQTGKGRNMQMAGFTNYIRMFQDDVFIQSIKNTFFYFILQVPIMLVVALVLACILNKKDLRFKGFFRTMIFLPCTTSLVAYSIIFRSFWGLMKREMYYGKKYKTKEELMLAIEKYIDYYTNKRVQRNLGVLTPLEFHEQKLESVA